MNDSPPSAPRPSEPPLIFEWKRDRGVYPRLAMWLVVVAAGHAALFYLFRVAPPLASRKPLPQHAVLYLPPGNPEVRALLSAISDRHPGSVIRSEDYDLKADMAALANVTPPSEPSWAGHLPALKDFAEPLTPRDLPGIMQPGEPVLPPGDPPAPWTLTPVGAPPVRPTLSAIIDEAPGARTAVQPPVWPEKLIDDSWPAAGSVTFMLGVDRNGRAEYCLPLATVTRVDLESLRGPLMGMKFDETVTGGIQWIRIVVRW